MSTIHNQSFCVGSQRFDPLQCGKDKVKQHQIIQLLFQNDLFGAVCLMFGLEKSDSYVYHAVASVQLHQAQRIVNMGGLNGLHDWYFDSSGQPNPPPPQVDIDAYVSIFKSQTTTESALRSFHNSAKKDSLRAAVASHLLGKRYLHSGWKSTLTIKRSTADTPYNPYFDFWEWSCHSLEWVGPVLASESLRSSHHVLPILMHHFGCVVPSHESLQLIKKVAESYPIVDAGSGNGYWTFMLRSYGMTVQPVDCMQSEWRASWISDTVVCDSAEWLQKNNGGRDMVLLLVYPIVGNEADGGQDGAFTRNTLAAFSGSTIIVAGTQNGNGYTGFKSQTMDIFMSKQYPDWTKIAQIALPSFAGKDEALYIFRRL